MEQRKTAKLYNSWMSFQIFMIYFDTQNLKEFYFDSFKQKNLDLDINV